MKHAVVSHLVYDAEDGDVSSLLDAVHVRPQYPRRRLDHRQVHQLRQRPLARGHLPNTCAL